MNESMQIRCFEHLPVWFTITISLQTKSARIYVNF